MKRTGKKFVKGVSLALTLCLLLGAAPLAASGLTATWQNIDVNNETIEYHNSPWRINVNKAMIWQNKSEIIENAASGTVHRSIPGARIERNYGRVGSDVASSHLYGTAGNAGYISQNYGTVDNNEPTGEIIKNYGSVSGDSHGTVMTNEAGGFIGGNGGTVGYNHGKIIGNYKEGNVYYNLDSGTIETNYGIVETNRGTINCNGGGISLFDWLVAVVTTNEGTIKWNSCNCVVEHNTGTVTKNSAYVYNYGGTVTDNADDGVVINYDGGRVENNTAEEGWVDNYEGGTVVNNTADGSVYDYGGAVIHNSGAYYHRVELLVPNVTTRYGEGFSLHNNRNGWLREGDSGKLTLIPQKGYRLHDIPLGHGITAAAENEDGSWELTIGGVTANVDNHTFGLETTEVHTVTIDVGGCGENLSVAVPAGESFFMALYESGVFAALEAMETDDTIFRDICTKPLEAFADAEEMDEDAGRLLNSAVSSDMTVYANFFQKIRRVEMTVQPPVAGTEVTGDWEHQTNPPQVTLGDNAHCSIYMPPVWDFEGVIQPDAEYETSVTLVPDFGWWLEEQTLTVTVSGGTLKGVSGRMAVRVDLSAKATAGCLVGDANGDGAVTIEDVTLIQHYLAELAHPAGINVLAADANRDGTVDISDATVVQMYLAEYPTAYPIGQTI